MKKLSEVVNVLPVIAKSDSLSLDERVAFKLKVGLHHFASTVLISL
jgi:septin 3/9/12